MSITENERKMDETLEQSRWKILKVILVIAKYKGSNSYLSVLLVLNKVIFLPYLWLLTFWQTLIWRSMLPLCSLINRFQILLLY